MCGLMCTGHSWGNKQQTGHMLLLAGVSEAGDPKLWESTVSQFALFSIMSIIILCPRGTMDLYPHKARSRPSSQYVSLEHNGNTERFGLVPLLLYLANLTQWNFRFYMSVSLSTME